MSDETPRTETAPETNPFDVILGDAAAALPGRGAFATVFRGYDKEEVDDAIAELAAQLRTATQKATNVRASSKQAVHNAETQAQRDLEELRTELADAQARADRERTIAEAQTAELKQAKLRAKEDAAALQAAESQRLAAEAQVAESQAAVQALTEELTGSAGESAGRHKFEEILRVAEDQASQLIRNASVQGDRLLEAAREEVQNRRAEVKAESEVILARAEHDAQQARLKIETELTAHTAQIERERAHAAEKVSQAEQEAAAIRTEADKGAAALRSTVARETEHARGEAERAVNDLRLRALEFEESLTRRQDDAQQEFLMLHNQAVAHAERITQDANEQVAASLDHAQRVSAKADDFERLMRAQAQQIEADANLRSREILDRARVKATKIIDTVTGHTQNVLRDAEDRTRQLRWQQQQLSSFMAEVHELLRPESAPIAEIDGSHEGGREQVESSDEQDDEASVA